MLDIILIFLCLAVFTVGLSILANRFRRTYEMKFELKPNCLLTRWPVIFVTGPRSLFYFSHYWNLYTVFLAEHGYEIFTVHLPWRNELQRRERFELFLRHQADTHKNFHLVLDTITLREFEPVLANIPHLSSITEIATDRGQKETTTSHLRSRFNVPYTQLLFGREPRPGLLLRFSYFLHKLSINDTEISSLNALGAVPETAQANSLILLDRVHTLAETDLRADV